MPIVRIGICGPEVGDEVETAAADERVEGAAQNSRTFGSMASILRGVKTRDRARGAGRAAGGSSKMIEPGGISMSALMISRSVPLAEL